MKRWPYLVLFFVNAITAGILVAYGDDMVAKAPGLYDCNRIIHPHCVGNQIVYRASMAIAFFFFFMMVWSALTESSYSKKCAYIGLELPLYIALFVGFYFIPNSVFEVYAWIAAILSVIFITMQIVILLDCVYDIRDTLLDKITADPDARAWQALYVILSFGALIGAVVGLVFLYISFSDLQLALVFLIITSIFTAFIPLLGVNDRVGAGLLPPAAMCLYLVFLCWQAVSKISRTDKPPTASSSPILVPSAIIGALAVSWTSWRTTESTKSFFRLEVNDAPIISQEAEKPQSQAAEGTVAVAIKDVAVTIEPKLIRPSWQFFFIMFCSSFYMAMVMTNWGMDTGPLSGDTAAISVWVQISSQWATAVLFVWSLIAPLVFPNRDFS